MQKIIFFHQIGPEGYLDRLYDGKIFHGHFPPFLKRSIFATIGAWELRR